MHLALTYALGCGAKIDKCYIYKKAFPLPFNKYITIQPFAKYQSKNYDLWNDVLDILLPILNKEEIKVVQVGGKDEPGLKNVFYTQGQTTYNQLATIIGGALLHVGADSVGVHMASNENKKIVSLYSNNFASNVGPYFNSNPEKDWIYFESFRETGDKPSFSAQEMPKSINKIKPEKIAAAVCKLLELPFNYPYQTVYVGDFYNTPLIECVPNQVVDPKSLGMDSIISRQDLLPNEQVLTNQLQHSTTSIYTDRPIDLKLLETFRGKIRELIYVVTEKHNPHFVRALERLGIRYVLVSFLSEEALRPIKLDYMDLQLIHRKKSQQPAEVSDLDKTKLYYKSNRFLLSEGKIYLSSADWQAQRPIPGFHENIQPLPIRSDFWEDSEHVMILQKTT